MGYDDRRDVGGGVAGGSCSLNGSACVSVSVCVCVVHTVVRTFAVLLTVQITGLLPWRTVRHL